jgi:hypothetical protein
MRKKNNIFLKKKRIIIMDNEKLFAIKLADEDKKIRDKCLAKIKNYLKSRSATENGIKIIKF